MLRVVVGRLVRFILPDPCPVSLIHKAVNLPSANRVPYRFPNEM